MPVIYRVNMSDLSVRTEPSSDAYFRLGGRAFTSALVDAEVPATSHPLAAENKLVFAPGILTGTGAPCSGRLSVGAKSPLTGGIKESNSGGMGAIALSALGIQGIVLEGKPRADTWYRLVVTSGGLRIEPAENIAGLGNYDATEKLRQEFGDKAAYMTIGPAGEMACAGASIAVTDIEGRPTRHAGRGGMGAVMGSKRVKAIIVDPSGGQRPQPANSSHFKTGAKRFQAALKSHPLTGETLPTYGTNALAHVMNEAGGFPTRNFREGQFEGTEPISGERQHDVILERGGKIAHPCHRGCSIRCSRIYHDKNGQFLTKGPEYETVWAHGANCGIDDLDAIAQMDRMEDDLGLDTIETGATLAVAMEAGILAFGDAAGAIRLLQEVQQRTPLGRLLASGADVLGKAYGVEHIPTVKGQAMPAYDPRAVKGIGVTYATSPMGADHTAGYTITANVLGVGGHVDPLSPKGQIELSRDLQIATAAIDATGLCLFVAFAVLDNPEALKGICEMVSGLFGSDWSGDDFLALGKATLVRERHFNMAAGFAASDDRLPDFFQKEPLPPHQALFDVPNAELDQVFNFVS